MQHEDYKRFLDSDYDGLSDWEEEYIYHTNSLSVDTDGDGMIDSEEIILGRNPREPGMLENFFIPHDGNNYHPSSLHPYRLLGHAVSAIIIKIIIFIFVVFFPLEAWLTPDLLSEQSKKIIDLTNELRRVKGVHILEESPYLNQAAFAKAQDMLFKQYFEHFSPDKVGLNDWLKRVKYDFSVAGENLAMGFGDAAGVVDAWTKSKTHYSNLIDSDFAEIGVGMVNGVFNKTETTLVAQFFGKPRYTEISQSSKQFLINQNSSHILDLGVKTALAKNESNVKLNFKNKTINNEKDKKEKELLPLLSPILVSPQNNFLSSNKFLTLKIFAPEAEKIFVYINDKEIMVSNLENKETLKSEYFNLDYNFPEGRNSIFIKSIRGQEQKISENYFLTIDTTPPFLDREKSEFFISFVDNDKKAVRVVAYLSIDTQNAWVEYYGKRINLTLSEDSLNKWIGNEIIFENKEDEIIIPPSLLAIDKAGNELKTDIKLNNIYPNKVSLLSKYFVLKNAQPESLKKIFNISSWYYKGLIIFLCLALFINIFIEIKKQKPHIILSTISVIGLLILLIFV